VEYCCFICKAFPRFDFIQYDRQAMTYIPVQVTVNTPFVRMKQIQAVSQNPDSYSYSCLCERSLRISAQCTIRSFVINSIQFWLQFHRLSLTGTQ